MRAVEVAPTERHHDQRDHHGEDERALQSAAVAGREGEDGDVAVRGEPLAQRSCEPSRIGMIVRHVVMNRQTASVTTAA